MIIDTIQVAGLDAYFRHLETDALNLASAVPVTARTRALPKGKQRQMTALHLLIEAADLHPLFHRPEPPDEAPLFSITVMKEMFPGLFADPFRHRVHNIAGFEDFKRGVLVNGKVMDVEGIPTIVSVGTGDCTWTSPIYPMREAVALDAVSWELATSRLTPQSSFTHSLRLNVWAEGQPIDPIELAVDYEPNAPRLSRLAGLSGVTAYQVVFEASVTDDSYIHEKHTPLGNESIGRPLLRAVNLLEPVASVYDIYSLHELLALATDYHLFEADGQPLRKMLVTLNLSATLVFSENQKVEQNSTDFEFAGLQINYDGFELFEARMEVEESIKIMMAQGTN